MTPDIDRLRHIVGSCEWLLRVLETVRESGLPDAWVGAGAVRDLVWGRLYGPGFDPGEVNDVDVVFFDPADLGRDRDEQATRVLAHARPDVPWQARNQAAVHTWYAGKFGGDPVQPFSSVADAVATWPETATAVAVRLDPAGGIEVCAPLGLADLLAGVWRRNPRRASLRVSLDRLARHRPAERWPAVRVIPP
ncbi:nucleotidyltransferase family protein [Planosporangium mesophilum]|uniref:Nucleotidyltransferase family protein n=1 Tax=Planosporangium mesophilum TaxID=689768 RepID=A0A8J3X5U1_9ACTN|nr:nucleotidyltransferase family protein [Planosporangium mesophilum]NJC85869.1 nucleotidyltransferase family protein [Planosporangium mesophilum]GII25083.1 hypothetical protein Pme01_46800 [Planosporangium mesophilum]